MATVKRQDVCFGVEYFDQTKQKKVRWVKVGKAFHSDTGGISVKLDTVPAAGWDGWLNLFDEREPQAQQTQPQRSAQQPYGGPQSYQQSQPQAQAQAWDPQSVGLPPMDNYDPPF